MKKVNPIARKLHCISMIALLVIAANEMATQKLFASSSGDSFSSKCPELEKCIKAVSELTGDKYVFTSEVRGKVAATDNVELTKENASLLLSKVLNFSDFTRVPLGEKNTYQILRQRDARDTLLPKVTATADTPPELPSTYDLFLLTYQAKNPEVVEDMARTSRSFLPANARIVPIEISGQVLITATAPEIKNVYEIIREMDKKPSKELLAKWKQREKDRERAIRTEKKPFENPEESGSKSKGNKIN